MGVYNSLSASEFLIEKCSTLFAFCSVTKFPFNSPSPRGEGQGGVAKDSMSASEFLIKGCDVALRFLLHYIASS